ncbi:hypothetical protein Q8A67_018603 [Cirrhinus molitorella]|uniref:Uncharacterized protein n=1 Tax=Cirrhinus molitorella TaxID=172907 RepID=A0AA88PD43_9TELE|nr:hypothetical protein Q8A67_018603 [Cirrhinus molitorella]
MQAPRGFWKDRPSGLCAVEVWFEKHCRGPMSKGEAKRKAAACEAPLGFEPRISCLQDRRFDQLSHGARLFRFVRLGRYPSKAGEGVAWQGKPPAVLTLLRVPTRRPFLKKRLLGRIEARDQRHRWDSNPGSPVY